MDRNFFYIACTKLAHDIHCSDNINANKFLTPYWEHFKNLPNKRFADVCNSLSETWIKRIFPSKADFITMLRQTQNVPQYKPDRRDDAISPYGPYAKEMAEKFKIMGEITDTVCSEILGDKYIKGQITSNTSQIMSKFYKLQVKNNYVYCLQTKQWKPRHDAKTFPFFDPAEMGLDRY